MRNPFAAGLAAAVLAGTAAPAAVQAADPLVVTTRMLAEVRTPRPDGTVATRLVPPANVVPGDRVRVVLAYRNTGRAPIADLVLANPVPRGTRYRRPADGSPMPEVSVDGRRFAPLAALGVVGAGGTRRPAVPDDVTQVRWRLASPLTAGSQGELAFEAVVQ